MPISIGEWSLTYWEEHVQQWLNPDPGQRPMECTACPGDVLFVPHGWWHMVLNIDDDNDDDGYVICSNESRNDDQQCHGGTSMALTRNYVSASKSTRCATLS